MRTSIDLFTASQAISTPNTIASSTDHVDMAEQEHPSGESDGTLEAGLSQANKEQVDASSEQALPTEPYCAFTKGSKLFIVITVSLVSFFSPFSINIYVPALPQISQILHISDGESTHAVMLFGDLFLTLFLLLSSAATNVTVTVFMIAQGLSPVIWAPLSDVSVTYQPCNPSCVSQLYQHAHLCHDSL